MTALSARHAPIYVCNLSKPSAVPPALPAGDFFSQSIKKGSSRCLHYMVWPDSVRYPYLRHSHVCGKQTEITAQLDMHPKSWRSYYLPTVTVISQPKPKWAVCWQLPCTCIVPCPGCFVNSSVPWQKNFLKGEILSLFPCILSKAVLCCPWCSQHHGRRFPLDVFHRGWNNFFLPPIDKERGWQIWLLHGLTWFSSVFLSSLFSRMQRTKRSNRPLSKVTVTS